tara:strand:- start:13594 stop:13815 length:222 start_codon:yes stop_codon:yes gene_type:complete
MNYSDLVKKINKLFEKKKLSGETLLSELDYDSLKILEILAFADKYFPKLNLDANKLYECKKVKDLIKLFNVDR